MKRKFLLSILAILSLFLITGCEETNTNTGTNEQTNQEQKDEIKENEYAEDDIVNKFITLYNNSSSNLMDQIEKGNIRTKYYGHVLGHSIEMINANSAAAGYFSISINGSNDESDVDTIISIYKDIVKIADNDITDEKVEESANMMKNSSTMIEEYEVTENIKITYVPVVQLSNRKTNCRIDIHAYNFK